MLTLLIAHAFGAAAANQDVHSIGRGCGDTDGRTLKQSECPSSPPDASSFIQTLISATKRGKESSSDDEEPNPLRMNIKPENPHELFDYKKICNDDDNFKDLEQRSDHDEHQNDQQWFEPPLTHSQHFNQQQHIEEHKSSGSDHDEHQNNAQWFEPPVTNPQHFVQQQAPEEEKSSGQNAGNGLMYDVYGHAVVIDSAYHAAIQFVLGESSVIVDMAPNARVQVTDTRDHDFGEEHQYLMMLLNENAGYMATCHNDKAYESKSLRLRETTRLRDLVCYWRTQAKTWHPDKYNCQSFAKDILVEVAADQESMGSAVAVLMHNHLITDGGFLNTNIAGALANLGGLFMKMSNDLLGDVYKKGKYRNMLYLPIIEARLWYTSVPKTYKTTNSESHKKDHEFRQAQLCKYKLEGGVMVKPRAPRNFHEDSD